jgi:hypothetical protein
MNWFPCFSINEFKNSLRNWSSHTIVVIIVCVRGRRNNKGEFFLLIANGEGEFDKDVFIIRNNFIIKYEQLFEAYNGG